jgi:hypothetical protein
VVREMDEELERRGHASSRGAGFARWGDKTVTPRKRLPSDTVGE